MRKIVQWIAEDYVARYIVVVGLVMVIVISLRAAMREHIENPHDTEAECRQTCGFFGQDFVGWNHYGCFCHGYWGGYPSTVRVRIDGDRHDVFGDAD